MRMVSSLKRNVASGRGVSVSAIVISPWPSVEPVAVCNPSFRQLTGGCDPAMLTTSKSSTPISNHSRARIPIFTPMVA